MKVFALIVVLALAPQSVHAASALANEESIYAVHNEESMSATANPASNNTGVSEKSIQKIQMVIATLKDIHQSVVDEEAEQKKTHEQFMDWCSKELDLVNKDVSNSKDVLQEDTVKSEQMTSFVEFLKTGIAKDDKSLEETKDSIDQSTNLRHKENDEYTEDMEINTQSLGQLDTAIEHVSTIKKQGGFLQNGVYKNLRISQPGDSSYVLGVMKGLKEKLDKTRTVMQTAEKAKDTMYNEFMQTKGQLHNNLEHDLQGNKISLGETEAYLTGLTRHLGKLKKHIEEASTYAVKSKEKCEKSKKEWEVRQEDRAKEKAALSEAIRYLERTLEEDKALLQRSAEEDNEYNQAVVFATSFLQSAHSRSSHRVKTSSSGEDLPNFDAVKGVVKKMISYQKDSQEDETTKKKYCEKQLAELEDDKAETSDDLAATVATIEKKEAEVDSLSDEIKQLYDGEDGIKERLEAAGVIRKKEQATFMEGSKDRMVAVKILSQAKAVLQAFYDQGETKLAGKTKSAPKDAADTSRKTVASFGALSMIQEIIDDIMKDQSDATMNEKDAQADFKDLQEESAKTTDEKQATITDRVKLRAKLRVQLNSLKETRTEKSNDLKSIHEQLGAMHSECDELLKNYDQRLQGRGFEVDQLRDVMDVLSGSSIAARTGFLDLSDTSSDSDADADSDEFDFEDKHVQSEFLEEDDSEPDDKEDAALRAKEDTLLKSLEVTQN